MQKFVQPSLLALQLEDEELNKNIVTLDSPRFDEAMLEFSVCSRFGFDIETFSLADEFATINKVEVKQLQKKKKEALYGFKGYIRLLQVALDCGLVIVADLGGRHSTFYEYTERLRRFVKVLGEKLWDDRVETIGFNLKFDLVFILHHLGLPARNCFDCMLASQILWSGIGVISAKKAGGGSIDRSMRCLLPHNLKAIATRLALNEVDKSEQVSNWAWHLTNKQINYAAKDAFIVLEMRDRLMQRIEKNKLEYSIAAENLALPVFIDMEYMGYPVDAELLTIMLEEYQNALASVLQSWDEEFPTIPWRATKKDLVPAINAKYETSIEAADDANLAPLNFPAIKSLLDARTLAISIKYLEKIQEQMFLVDGQYTLPSGFRFNSVRSKFRQIVTGWRSASGDAKETGAPNLQNAPKLRSRHKKMGLRNVREIFKAPPGYKLLIVDLSAAHARIAAQMSGDPIFVQVYKDGLDNHLLLVERVIKEEGYNLTFKELLEIRNSYKYKCKHGGEITELESKVEKLRDYCKTAFYAWLNQASAPTMTASFAAQGLEVSLEYCELLIKNLREVYCVLYKFIRDKINECNAFNLDVSKLNYQDVNGKLLSGSYGKIKSLTGGITYCLKLYNARFGGKWQVAYNEAVSLMWLMSEASMIKSAMGKYRLESLARPEWDSYICNFAHDEANAIVKEEFAIDAAKSLGRIVRQELEQFITLFPVEEDGIDYSSFIVDSWSQK